MSANLILHWMLDQLGEGTTVTDETENYLNGTYVGNPKMVPDEKFGSCLSFDGSSDSITVPDTEALRLSKYTVEVWVKPENNNTLQGVVGKRGRNYNIWLDRAGYVLHRFHAGSNFNAKAPDTEAGSIVWKQWNHIAITNDGETARTYINGLLKAEGTVEDELKVDNTRLLVGRSLDDNVGAYYKGCMAHVRLYDDVLTVEEIRRDMIQDESAASAFVRSHPIEFELYNEDNHHVLLIDDHPQGQTLYLDILNSSTQNIELQDLGETATSQTHHFELRFRPETIARANLAQIAVATAGWSLDRAPNGTALYLLYQGATTLAAGQKFSLQLTGMNADGRGGTRGTRVEMGYGQMRYVGEGALLKGYRLQYLDIVNHRGRPNIPLHVGFVGGNRVLSDGYTQNTLKLRIANLSRDKDLRLAKTSRFRVSFDVQGENETREWALVDHVTTNSVSIGAIEYDLKLIDNDDEPIERGKGLVVVTHDDNSYYARIFVKSKKKSFNGEIPEEETELIEIPGEETELIQELEDGLKHPLSIENDITRKNNLVKQILSVAGHSLSEKWKIGVPTVGQIVEWEIAPTEKTTLEVPTEEIILKTDDYILLQLSGVIVPPLLGHAHIYIDYEDIPGYQNGTFTVVVEKSPLLFSNNNVGIGTDKPEAKLQIINASQDANGNTLVLGPKDQCNLRLGYHEDYSWIQSHGNKPLAINPIGNNVGIGTTSPVERLQIADFSSQSDNYLKISTYGYNRFRAGIKLRVYDDNNGFTIENDEREQNNGLNVLRHHHNEEGLSSLFINKQDGNVGIGTTSPEAKLRIINANQDANGNTLILGPQNQSNLRLGYHESYSWIQSHGGKSLAINPIGNNVGIGKYDPQERLEVNGNIKLSGYGKKIELIETVTAEGVIAWGSLEADSYVGLTIGFPDQAFGGKLKIGTWHPNKAKDFQELMRISANGNVGIGTTSPGQKLTVSGGNIQIDQNQLIGQNFNDKFTYDGKEMGHYSLGWFNDSWNPNGSTAWISSYGGVKFFSSGAPTVAIDQGGNLEVNGVLKLKSENNELKMYINDRGLIFELTNSTHGASKVVSWDGDNNWDHGTAEGAASDRRLKTDIEKEENILSRLMELEVKNFRWKEKPEVKAKEIGFIAQDVQPLFPTLVGERKALGEEEATLTLKYADFAVLTVGGLKELKLEKDVEIAELRAKLNSIIAGLK